MMKGTGAMKAMKESAMKAMHASPKKAMKESPNKAMSPKKKMTDEKLMNKFAKLGREESAKSGNYKPQTKQPVKEARPQSLKPEARPKPQGGVKPKVPPPGVKSKIHSKMRKIDRKLLNPNENRPKYGSAKKAMKESPKKAMSPKKRMTDEKDKTTIKKYRKSDIRLKTPPGGGEKYAEMMRRMRESGKGKDSKYKRLKDATGSPKKAMSPKKKTIAKDKDPKFKKSNRRSQAEFEPMYEGADISRAQFNRMSKREQRRYIKTQTD